MDISESPSPWLAGIARRKITPSFNVELAGLGYYLGRTGQRVRDDLAATACVVANQKGECAVFIALDILYIDEAYVSAIRERAEAITGIPAQSICINCSHSHNAPTMAFVRGVGEIDQEYINWVISETTAAVVDAWSAKQPVALFVGSGEVKDFTFNRTRENGPMDTQLNVLRIDSTNGDTMAVLFNFHSHLNAHLEVDLRAISRDWSGEVIDQVESAFTGAIAMYLQGTCGDVMVRPEFSSTDRRFELARGVAGTVLDVMKKSRRISGETIRIVAKRIKLPARRWTHDEIERDRQEGQHRLKTGDTQDWLTGIARAIVTYPERLPRRYGGSVELAVRAVSRFAVEWTDAILPVLATRPGHVETEVQAIRVGDAIFAANSAELFTSLGLEVRSRVKIKDLFMLGYSNGAIGYLPDTYDIERKSYAAVQSPKFIGQFPFTPKSGDTLVKGLVDVIQKTHDQ